jgi:hypothetical protein
VFILHLVTDPVGADKLILTASPLNIWV